MHSEGMPTFTSQSITATSQKPWTMMQAACVGEASSTTAADAKAFCREDAKASMLTPYASSPWIKVTLWPRRVSVRTWTDGGLPGRMLVFTPPAAPPCGAVTRWHNGSALRILSVTASGDMLAADSSDGVCRAESSNGSGPMRLRLFFNHKSRASAYNFTACEHSSRVQHSSEGISVFSTSSMGFSLTIFHTSSIWMAADGQFASFPAASAGASSASAVTCFGHGLNSRMSGWSRKILVITGSDDFFMAIHPSSSA
mmetsp:Transcript_6836/g.14296  ORF Transcript_6836/g.14296 Transcript_6836/m.14296 type:complete len:256 (-) Transcript_6836:170-937(-)